MNRRQYFDLRRIELWRNLHQVWGIRVSSTMGNISKKAEIDESISAISWLDLGRLWSMGR